MIRYQPEGGWTLTTSQGSDVPGALLAGSFSTPWLILLSWSTPLGRLHALICRDSLDAEGFRQLRVALRLGAGKARDRLI